MYLLFTKASIQNHSHVLKCSLWQCFLRKALCFLMWERKKSHFSSKTQCLAEIPVDVSSFLLSVFWNLAWAFSSLCLSVCVYHLCLTSWRHLREVWPSDTRVGRPQKGHDLWRFDPQSVFGNFRQRLSNLQTDDQWQPVSEMLQICLNRKNGFLWEWLYFRCASRWLRFSILTAHTRV